MGFLSKVFCRKSKSLVDKLVKDFGYEDASILLYGLVISKFDHSNIHVLFLQTEQFIREEFDAASQGSSYSKQFVNNICSDVGWYEGARKEDAEYPIDEADGPQQTLLSIIIPLINEGNGDFAVKLRCDIVKMIYEDLEILRAELIDAPVSASDGYNFTKRRDRLDYLMKLKA